MPAIAISTESMIVRHMLADGLIDDALDGRVFARMAAQGAALPFSVVLRVSADGHHVHAEPTDLETSRVQVSTYAGTAQECAEVSRSIRRVLDGYRGEMVGVRVHFCRLLTERDAMEGPSDGSDMGPFATHQDYTLSHRKAG